MAKRGDSILVVLNMSDSRSAPRRYPRSDPDRHVCEDEHGEAQDGALVLEPWEGLVIGTRTTDRLSSSSHLCGHYGAVFAGTRVTSQAAAAHHRSCRVGVLDGKCDEDRERLDDARGARSSA